MWLVRHFIHWYIHNLSWKEGCSCLWFTSSLFLVYLSHDDVIKWKHFPRYWPFVRGIHRSPVNSPHKGQWHGALMFSLISVWKNDWVNNREAGDLRRYRDHYNVIVMNRMDRPQHNLWFDHFSRIFSGLVGLENLAVLWLNSHKCIFRITPLLQGSVQCKIQNKIV